MGLLSHQMLQIVKGVGPTPGDTSSAEQPLVGIDLLDTGSGISLDLEDGWEPNIPSLKNSGLWADSPISDGRTLIAGANTNVTETMRLIVSTGDAKVFAAKFSELQLMIQDARANWDTFYQIEPVYLAWWAAGAPAAQYALIYNIDADVQYGDSEDANARITLTIEREVGWRGVVPGKLPTALSSVNVNNATTQSSSTAYNLKAFLDIPAASVPGDLPALLLIDMLAAYADAHAPAANQSYLQTLMVARRTRMLSAVNTATGATAYLHSNYFPAVPSAGSISSSLGTDTASEADTGVADGNRAHCTFATTPADTIRLTWTTDMALFSGRYAVFARMLQSGGSANEISVYLQYGMQGSDVSLTPVSPTVQAIATPTEFWPDTYMGIITLPTTPSRVQMQGAGGKGIQVINTNLVIRLRASGVAAGGDLYVAGLVLMPIEECAALLSYENYVDANYAAAAFQYDTTGYHMHGQTDAIALDPSTNFQKVAALAGARLTLEPKKINRLYFHHTSARFGVTTLKRSSTICNPGSVDAKTISLSCSMYVIPRWLGIRDG